MVGSRAAGGRALVGLVAAAATAAAVGPAAGGAPPAPRTGSAATVISLPTVTVTLPSGAQRSVTLGRLDATAATSPARAAALGLQDAAVAGVALPAWTVDGGTTAVSGDRTLPLTAPGVTGSVGLVGYHASTALDTATARLDALTAAVTAAPADLQVDLGQHGLGAEVTGDRSAGDVELTVQGLRLSLGDLLPSAVLGALPLDRLLAMVPALGLPLPADATGLAAALADLTDRLADVDTAAGRLATAKQTLAGLLAALPGASQIQQAQQDLTDAQATLDATAADLQTALGQLGTDTATVQSLTGRLADATADVTAAQQQVADLTALVGSLTTSLASVTQQLTNLMLSPAQLLSLTTQQASLQQQLAAAQSQLDAATQTLADAQAAAAALQTQLDQAKQAVAADQATVTTLQQQLAAEQQTVDQAQAALDALLTQLNDASVTAAQQAVTDLTATLTDAVDTVTAAIGALPDLTAVRDELLTAVRTSPLLDVGTIGMTIAAEADDAAGTGTTTCTVAGATLLGQPLPLGGCADLVSAFGQIRTAVAAALGTLPALAVPLPTLDGLATTTSGAPAAAGDVATQAGAGVTPLHLAVPVLSLTAAVDATRAGLLSALGSASAAVAGAGVPALTTSLSGPLATVSSAVTALPSGAALAGLTTIGLDAALVGVSSTAVHGRSLPAPPAAPGGSTPAGPTTPGGPTTPAGAGGTAGAGGSTGPAGTGSDVPAAGTVRPPTEQPRRPGHHPSASPVPVGEPALPFTGGDSAIEAAAALVVALAGAHLVLTGRRRT